MSKAKPDNIPFSDPIELLMQFGNTSWSAPDNIPFSDEDPDDFPDDLPEEKKHDRFYLLGYLLFTAKTMMKNFIDLFVSFHAGAIGVDSVTTALQVEVQDAHSKAAYVGRVLAGDKSKFNSEDIEFGEAAAESDFVFLDKFTEDVRAGRYDIVDEETGEKTLKLDAVEDRSSLYAARLSGTTNETFVAASDPHDLWEWKLGAAEHCDDCIELADGSPYRSDSLPTFPGAGSTQCVTTPESRILTKRGHIAMNDLVVGDLVWTHRNRWRPITALHLNRSYNHQQAWMTAPNGAVVGCTADHRWLTPVGWETGFAIDRNELLVYTIDYEKVMYKMQRYNAFRQKRRYMQVLRKGLQLRKLKRSQSNPLQKLHVCQSGPTAMEDETFFNNGRNSQKLDKSEKTICRFDDNVVQPNKTGRKTLRILLGGSRGEEVHLSLPMDLDLRQWRNPERNGFASCQPRLYRRQVTEFRIENSFRSRIFAHDSRSQIKDACPARFNEYRENQLHLRDVRQGVSELQAGGQRRQEILLPHLPFEILGSSVRQLPCVREGIQEVVGSRKFAKILLAGMLPQGTPLYDITVDEDHSFVIEGMIAHNCLSRCKCSLIRASDGAAGADALELGG